MRAVSKKRQAVRPSEAKARAIVRVRCAALNYGRCEICAAAVATDFAHRLARSRMGEWTASNGLATCRLCHEAQRDGKGGEALATRLGQVLPSLVEGVKPDPSKIPVATAYGWVLLADDGDVIPANAAVMMT